jgi:hypothetical protein
VRDVLVGLDDLEKTMEPLEKVRDFVWLLEGKFGSLEEGLKAMELDARERLVFVDLASTIEGATLALERISLNRCTPWRRISSNSGLSETLPRSLHKLKTHSDVHEH